MSSEIDNSSALTEVAARKIAAAVHDIVAASFDHAIRALNRSAAMPPPETTVSDSAPDGESVEEFAVRNGISRAQGYKEIAAGRLVARKVNSRTIITREDAAAWRRSLPKMSTNTAEAAA